MEYLLFFCIMLILTLISRIFNRSILSPALFMNFLWISFYFLHMLIGEGFYISYGSVCTVLFFLLCFNIGTWISQSNRPSICCIYKLRLSAKNLIQLKKFILIFTIISIFASLYYFYIFVSYCGGFAMYLASDIRSEMLDISVPIYVRIPMLLSYTLTLVAAVYYVKFGGFLRLTFATLPILISSVAQNGRAGFLMMIFILSITSLLRKVINGEISKPKVNLLVLKYGGYLALAGGFFFIVGLLFRLRNAGIDDNSYFFDSFKSYLLGGISSFDTYLGNPKTLGTGFGRYNFSSLYGLLGIAVNEVGVYTDYLTFNSAGATTNIFTLFRPVLDDFGYLFGGIYLMLIGLWGQNVYRKVMRGDEGSLPFLILYYTYLFHSPLLPITVHTSILLSFFVPGFIIKKFSKKIIL